MTLVPCALVGILVLFGSCAVFIKVSLCWRVLAILYSIYFIAKLLPVDCVPTQVLSVSSDHGSKLL